MTVEILNWSKYNPRTHIKHPRWLAVSNRIAEDSELFDLSDAEFKAWIYILCQASQRNSSVIEVNFSHAERVSAIKRKTFLNLAPKLQKAKCIQLRDHNKNTRDLAVITTEQTEQTEQNKQNTPAKSFDFEALYFLYPRKEGKSDGIRICEKQIKTSEDYEFLRNAILRYRKHCEETGAEKKFIKHFSTFMGRWRDWLDPDAGSSDLKTANGVNWGEVFNGKT